MLRWAPAEISAHQGTNWYMVTNSRRVHARPNRMDRILAEATPTSSNGEERVG